MPNTPSDIIQKLIDSMGLFVDVTIDDSTGVRTLRVQVEGFTHIDDQPYVSTYLPGLPGSKLINIAHIIEIIDIQGA